MMVSNDMASAPALRAAYSISAATSVSRIARANDFECAIEKAGTQKHRRSNAGDLFLVLHHAGLLDQRRGLAQTEARRQHSGQARPGRHRHVLALNPNFRGSSTAFLPV